MVNYSTEIKSKIEEKKLENGTEIKIWKIIRKKKKIRYTIN